MNKRKSIKVASIDDFDRAVAEAVQVVDGLAAANAAAPATHGGERQHHAGNPSASKTSKYATEFGTKRRTRDIEFASKVRERVPATSPGDVLGHDKALIREAIMQLAADKADTYVVPGSANKALLGHAAYPGGALVNPFAWAPIIAQHSPTQGLVFEVGPAYHGSALVVAELLERDVLVVQPPSGSGALHVRLDNVRALQLKHNGRSAERTVGASVEYSLAGLQPDLVLVALPLLADTWSLWDCVRAVGDSAQHVHMYNGAELDLWPGPTGQSTCREQVEFATDFAEYEEALCSRLRGLDALVGKGAKVCLSVPMHAGLPAAVKKTVEGNFTAWKLIDMRFALAADGAPHRGNGTPLLGTALTVWSAQ